MIPWSRLRDLVAFTGGISTLLAVLGYIGLRAHFNMLGVPLGESLGAERYLAETLVFATVLLARLAAIAAFATVLGGVALLVGGRRGRLALGRASSFLAGPSSRPAAVWLGSVVALLLLLLCLGVIVRRQDLVVGALDPDRIAWRRYGLFEPALVTTGLVLAAALRALPRTADGASDPLASLGSTALRVAAPAWVLVVAILFGQELRPGVYPRVAISHGEREPPLCGLLVVATEGVLRVWRVDFDGGRARGLVTSLQPSSETVVEFGRVEDIFLAAEQAMRMRTPVACPT